MFPVNSENEMENRIKNSTCIVSGKKGARFDGDDDQPENRGNPGLQKIAPVRAQEWSLLDAIIGGLAGDHHIVDVAFA